MDVQYNKKKGLHLLLPQMLAYISYPMNDCIPRGWKTTVINKPAPFSHMRSKFSFACEIAIFLNNLLFYFQSIQGNLLTGSLALLSLLIQEYSSQH